MRKGTETVVKAEVHIRQRMIYLSHQFDTWRSLENTKPSNYSCSFKCSLLILPVVWIVIVNGLRATASEHDIFISNFAHNINHSEYFIAQTLNPNQPVQNPQLFTLQPETPTEPSNTFSKPLDDRIRIRKIQVLDSTVFNENDFNRVVRSFEERDLTLEEIRKVADAVTQLYLNKGYINSRAIPYIQPSGATEDVLIIRVLEGRLTEIEIEGTRRLNPSYIRSRVKLGVSIPFNTSKLEEQLKLLRLDPLFDNVEASLRPTGKVGQSALIVRVQEANSLGVSLSVDNYSPPSIGAERLGIELRDRNLTGMGDELAGSYYHSLSGGSDVFDFSYQIPVNAMNGKVQIRAALNRNEITEPAFDDLGIRADQDLYEINYRQPLVRSPRQEFALSLGFTYQNGQTFLFDQLPTPFGIGPDKDGVSRTSVIKFGQDYVKREPQGAWLLRSQFSLGIDLFDATINNDQIPDGRFFSWLGQVQRVQRLSDDHLLLIQADLQLTPDSLLPSQQFVIGGGQSVRGYRQNARSGDNGFRFAVEDRMTVLRNASGLPTIQLAPFLDMGAVWNQSNNPNNLPNQIFLVSAGLGFLWNQAMGIDRLSLRLDYGIPFIELSDQGNNAQDEGFYFSIRYQP
ncbi:ShlB/FhaC/HecB family hemolysin secretion/activation protein [Nostoc sp. MG11]|uniref:ShlB/FhaC/HecB family hemolysin secretion/activation protein n=1 Tax=Nostoc sp. MG11 TaxID=2721166 RepID=UPI001867439F|nr:ShlB/FhaC/HecB family hemolysin secretion/activation protein [Nostoc sp. MG11]